MNRARTGRREVARANDRPTRRWQTAIRWKRGNRTAVVVLTNDLTPVWTVAFDEIRIISVGACQCKCHTYIQLPLVTLRSARDQPTTEYSCSTSFSPSAPADSRSPRRRCFRATTRDIHSIVWNGTIRRRCWFQRWDIMRNKYLRDVGFLTRRCQGKYRIVMKQDYHRLDRAVCF